MLSKYYFISKSQKRYFFKEVKDIFEKLEYSNKVIPNQYNFILENFDKDCFLKIKSIKSQYPNTKVIIICSEFINKKNETFNTFEFNFVFSNYFIYILYFFIELYKKIKPVTRNKKIKVKKKNTSNKYKNDFLFKLIEAAQYKKRYIFFNKILADSDLLVFTHSSNFKVFRKNKIRKYIFPFQIIINNKTKKNTFGFSGEVSNYRLKFFKDISKLNDELNEFKTLYLSSINNLNKNISNYDNGIYSFFSLNPKKTKNWKYSSPGRYLDSIRNGEVPLVFQKFNDKFSREISLNVEKYLPNKLYKLVEKKIEIKRHFLKKIKKIKKKQLLEKLKFKKAILKL